MFEFIITIFQQSVWFITMFIIALKFYTHLKNRRIIWHRLVLVALMSGLKGYWLGHLLSNVFLSSFTDFTIYVALVIFAFNWCLENDDDRMDRKRRRQQFIKSLKDLRIYGWQPGASPI